jgi:hypothetical protein
VNRHNENGGHADAQEGTEKTANNDELSEHERDLRPFLLVEVFNLPS